MSIAKRLEEQKRNHDDFVMVAHYLDNWAIDLKKILEKAENCSVEDLFSIECVNELREDGIDPQDSKKALIETTKATIFLSHISNILNIVTLKINPQYIRHLGCDISNGNFSTPRELFDVLQQLPSAIVEKELENLCEKINSFMLLDSYKEHDKEHFVQSFEQIPNNGEIMKYFRHIVMLENYLCDVKEFQNADHMTLSDTINVMESFKPDIKALTDYVGNTIYEYIKPWLDDPLEFLSDKPTITVQGLKDLYKETITRLIILDDEFDDFEKNIIDNVIKESGFADLYNELYPQCLKEVQQDIIKEGGKTLEPIDFPEHLGIEPEKKESFLRALYKELVGKSYISPNREDDFVYLLGGPIARPDDLMPINWLKKFKYTSQAFFAAFCGKEFKSWTTLDAIATFKGEPLSHSNNLPDLYEHYEDRTRPFISIIEEAKKITEAQG